MNNLPCIYCEKDVSTDWKFCAFCNKQLLCSTCSTSLIKNANGCVECGTPIAAEKKSNISSNSIEFRESSNERVFRAEFSDATANNVSQTFNDILSSRFQSNDLKALDISKINNENKKEKVSERKSEAEETIDTSHEEIFGQDVLNKDHALNNNNTEIEHLDDLSIRIDPAENIWMLIFAFYLSKFGTTTFTKQDMINEYKSRRYTKSRSGKMAENWGVLISKQFVKTVTQGVYKITDIGLQRVKDEMNGAKSSIKGKPKATSAPSISAERFDLHENDEKPSLESLLLEKKPSNNGETIAVIAFYIQSMNKQEFFTLGQIEYAYKTLAIKNRPGHLNQVIVNNVALDFFEKVPDTKHWRLARTGEIFVEQKLPKPIKVK